MKNTGIFTPYGRQIDQKAFDYLGIKHQIGNTVNLSNGDDSHFWIQRPYDGVFMEQTLLNQLVYRPASATVIKATYQVFCKALMVKQLDLCILYGYIESELAIIVPVLKKYDVPVKLLVKTGEERYDFELREL